MSAPTFGRSFGHVHGEPAPRGQATLSNRVMSRVPSRLLKTSLEKLVFGARHHTVPAMEAVYQQIVQRDLARLGVDDRFYPVGSAANYGLFYVIIRSLFEFPIRRVLELGAGQTSLLLDRLSGANLLKGEICTLEHDQGWSQHVSRQVRHRVLTTTLVEKEIGGMRFGGYELAPVDMESVDMLIIDGPPATTQHTCYSRLGAVELLDRIDAKRFIVVVDDAERKGEILLASKIEAGLKEMQIDYARGQVDSVKRQVIFAGGDYKAAAYY